ncbi:MAG: hypothetical protein MUC48_12075 [Leptolyngbya sp. Prado105]|jgi:hypothetical protein|nr:hypothetical protein [Leptolyngbya sp. Prado105]
MLTEVLQTYPQPIAYAYGNVYRSRSRSKPEELDQIFRCAEVTARYLSALAIASFAAREDASMAPPEQFAEFTGNLSFGNFLTVVQAVAKLTIQHPLQAAFSQSFLNKKSLARGKLEELLELRNQLGHDLIGFSEVAAITCLDSARPLEKLEEMLQGIALLCSFPLFLVDIQKPIRRVMHIVRLTLMGEQSEPVPEQLAVSEAFMDDKRLYIGTREGALLLHPMLVWGLERDRAAQAIYLLHQIKDDELVYKSLAALNPPSEPPVPEDLQGLLQGETVPLEPIKLHDGRSFKEDWEGKRELQQLNLVTSGQSGLTQPISWTTFHQETLRWYSQILKSRSDEASLQEQRISIDWNNPIDVIRQLLLDQRGEVTPEEYRQLLLLFGNGQVIRRAVGRDILDLRVRMSEEERWNDRQEISDNLLTALRKAVEFIGRHNSLIPDLSVNTLQNTVGSADYIAAREALINLIIHQDYNDSRTVAQIELEPYRTVMVNAGASLVSEEDLIDGGTSTARNPIVARALKLIGFAELGGSGLREVSRVWRNAQRRPPLIRSDNENNRFRIELDSRPLIVVVDDFWKQRLGVSVSLEEAKILGLIGSSPNGMTLGELCSGTGYRSRETEGMCQRLSIQGLIDCESGSYCLKPHLKEVVLEALG